ncbi:MAG: hypothetical protein DME98_07390 [Verrucomicrobia bacterium]|nr:MAG: hypothetical protein DME98_07390 [Verrucomicrobiota bacterium]
MKAMRGRIALQKHFVRNASKGSFRFAQLSECVRVLAPLCVYVFSAKDAAFTASLVAAPQDSSAQNPSAPVTRQFEFLGRCPKLS